MPTSIKAGGILLLALVIFIRPTCAATDDLLQRDRLSGEWGGTRSELARKGLELEAAYTADVFSNVRGGQRRRTHYLDNLDLTLTCRSPELIGVDAGTIFLYGLSNHGGNPSADVGDAQGVDNIEAPDTIKLYEAWLQRTFFDDRFSALLGLYDLNAEFDVIDSAAVFVNSSFGVGPEFSHTGVSGPSVFPTTSLGARLKSEPLRHVILQAAVLDGVPGDPNDPGGTQVKLSDDDGLLIASEAALVWSPGRGRDEGSISPTRDRRRRVGRGWGTVPYALKLAWGVWLYTTRLPHMADVGADGLPTTERGHPGFYLLADYDASHASPLASGRLSMFARAGIADGDVAQFDGYVGGGLVYTGLIPGREADRLGFAVAAAHNGGPFKRSLDAAGAAPAEAEITLEWTYRATLMPWLTVQPDVQYVIHPGGRLDRDNAVVLGLRLEVTG